MQRTQYLAELRQDLAFAARTLRRAPAVALTAVLMLALGIGATAAIFGALYAVVLRPLPFRDQDRIVMAAETWRGERGGSAAGTIAAWRREAKSFSDLAPVRFTSFNPYVSLHFLGADHYAAKGDDSPAAEPRARPGLAAPTPGGAGAGPEYCEFFSTMLRS